MVGPAPETEATGVHRIWVRGEIRAGDDLELEEGEARRLRKVLRLKPGDKVELFNDRRVEGEAEVIGLRAGRAQLLIHRVEAVDRESPLCLLRTPLPE